MQILVVAGRWVWAAGCRNMATNYRDQAWSAVAGCRGGIRMLGVALIRSPKPMS